jgi:hypothetical protein
MRRRDLSARVFYKYFNLLEDLSQLKNVADGEDNLTRAAGSFREPTRDSIASHLGAIHIAGAHTGMQVVIACSA